MEARSIWSRRGVGRLAVLALILVAMAALALGLKLPVLHLRQGLSGSTYSVLTGIANLAEGGNVLLALIVLAFSVLFPIAKLGSLLVLLFLRIDAGPRARTLRWLALLGRWSMLDVFVIAILVGAVELGLLSEGEPRPGIYVFAGAILLSMIATMAMERLAGGGGRRRPSIAVGGRGVRWLTVVSGILFVAGLSAPLMHVEKWYFWENEYSILDGTWRLAHEGEVLLAATVLLFVAALPLARFLGLVWLQWGRPTPRAAYAVLTLDKWAMFDVFGLALLIVIVKIGDIAAVEPRPGFWILLAATSLSLFDSWRVQRASVG